MHQYKLKVERSYNTSIHFINTKIRVSIILGISDEILRNLLEVAKK